MSATAEQKHTPGPWWTTDSGVRDVGGYICHTKEPTHFQGQDERYDKEVDERRANKNLIAASPNLLKALCMWMDIHKTPAGFAGKYGKELDAVLAAQQLRIDAAVSASLEAIAKATGATHDN